MVEKSEQFFHEDETDNSFKSLNLIIQPNLLPKNEQEYSKEESVGISDYINMYVAVIRPSNNCILVFNQNYF